MSYDQNAYLNFKRGQTIPCICDNCKKNFSKIRRDITILIKRKQLKTFCSKKCFFDFNSLKQTMSCSECNKPIFKAPDKRCVRFFCNRSCSARFNNKNKTHGNRRSKLEIWLESELLQIYPNLGFHFNRKDAINSELDIYIPSLKLAFELNGIFHYEPIFGEDKLSQIQNNDQRKFQACFEKGIELCIIDTSKQKYFKKNTCQNYLYIITTLVNSKLESSKTNCVEVL